MYQDMLRTSERSSFKRCQQRWAWSYVEGWGAKEPSKALWFGTGWHLVMADYYRKGKRRSKDYIDVWREYCNTEDADGLFQPVDELGEEWIALRDLGESMLHAYVDHWGKDKTWDVIATEMPGQLLIPAHDGKGKLQYNFTVDGVYRDSETKKIMLMEHKTAAQISTQHLTLDDQAGAYWAVVPTILKSKGILGKRDMIRGITYNFARKTKPVADRLMADGLVHNKPKKEHYQTALQEAEVSTTGKETLARLQSLAEENDLVVWGDVAQSQPPPQFLRHYVYRMPGERKIQVERIKAEHAQMEAVRSGALPIIKTPTRDCSWDCIFFHACELQESGGAVDDYLKQIYRKHDLHADHRKSS